MIKFRLPIRRMVLWHPISPGVKVTVDVRWPKYQLFSLQFATLRECLQITTRYGVENDADCNHVSGLRCIHGDEIIQSRYKGAQCSFCRKLFNDRPRICYWTGQPHEKISNI